MKCRRILMRVKCRRYETEFINEIAFWDIFRTIPYIIWDPCPHWHIFWGNPPPTHIFYFYWGSSLPCVLFLLWTPSHSPHIFISDFLSHLLRISNGIALKKFTSMNLDTCIKPDTSATTEVYGTVYLSLYLSLHRTPECNLSSSKGSFIN